MQIITFVPASAASFVGEWTGRIDGDFTGDAGAYGNFKHSADLTFVVAKDGSISGEGTGWEVFERGGGYLNGRADNVTFKIRGEIVDYDTGEARLRLEEIAPITYPVFNDQGTQVFVIWPFYNWEVFYIELREGTRVDNDAFRDAGSGDTSGTDEFVMTGGGGSNVECPSLTITPTMPPESDPRNLAGPTDTVSYRFQVAWEGTTPLRVLFSVQGGSDSVKPNFAFNPANMQTSPISVLMDVTTDGAEGGEYPLTVNAVVEDPSTGELCFAKQTATVMLVVGESRAADLPIVKRVGQVKITPEETDAGGQNVIIETGNDGAVKFIAAGIETADDSVSITALDIGSNTAIKEFSHLDYVDRILEDKANTAEAQAWADNDLLKYKSLDAWEAFKSSIQEYVEETTPAAYTNILSCLFYIEELCSGQSWVYVSNGELHLYHKTATGEDADKLQAEIEREFADMERESKAKLAWDKLLKALATPNALIIPNGTEITVDVQQSVGSSMTSVTVLDGSALVVDLVSEEIILVNAGEKYYMIASYGADSLDSFDTSNYLANVEQDDMLHWWSIEQQFQIGDFAVGKSWEQAFPYEPTNRTAVFSDQDQLVYAWIDFVNVPPPEHAIDFKWYQPDGALYLNETKTIGESELYPAWSQLFVNGQAAAGKPGFWKLNIYADSNLVKEIPFIIIQSNNGGGGCLIATAAFGSELTPQVQFLRNFRDNHILSTAAGSSFMNVFDSWYYSFSPSVADYEREQPWLQQTVKTAIYPLLGILTASEKAYVSMPGEYGAVTAGVIASSMIGAVYFWPAAYAAERFSKQKRMSYRVMIILVGASIFAAVISVLAANPVALMITTPFLVLTVAAISALFSARLIRSVINGIRKR